MPKSKRRSVDAGKRRVSLTGTRVLVCGRYVDKEADLICLLDPHVLHTTHIALGINVAHEIVLVYRKETKGGGGETVWASVADVAQAG
jgi:hypothetical protein